MIYIKCVLFCSKFLLWRSFILNKIAISVTINYHSMCNDLEPDTQRVYGALKLFPLHRKLIYSPTLHKKSKSLLTLSGEKFSLTQKLFLSVFVASRALANLFLIKTGLLKWNKSVQNNTVIKTNIDSNLSRSFFMVVRSWHTLKFIRTFKLCSTHFQL